MKILIADDQAKRYQALIRELESCGVQRNDIHIVTCANDARQRLESTHYELLILDLLLPLWPEGDPGIPHSLALLMEIEETDTLYKPDRILGITADKLAAGEAAESFAKGTWSIIEYSESNDEWINKIKNCVEYILKTIEDTPTTGYITDLAVICALEKPEFEELLKLPWNWSAAKPIDDNTFVRTGRFQVGPRSFSVVGCFPSRMGMIATALLSAKVISLLRPRLIAMCGICAGVKGKVQIGDVLLADPAWDFQSGKRLKNEEGSTFAIAPHQLHVPVLIRSHVEQLRGDAAALGAMSENFGSDFSGKTRIVVAPVASGSAVIADGTTIESIKSQHRELSGVEMEIYGMYAAAASASHPQPKAFALKGVCDFANSDKNDQFQRYAAYASANVLRLLMERFGDRLF